MHYMHSINNPAKNSAVKKLMNQSHIKFLHQPPSSSFKSLFNLTITELTLSSLLPLHWWQTESLILNISSIRTTHSNQFNKLLNSFPSSSL
ncbi:hypothetical protein RIF29_23761 [Crotalaria pallida]|uniref:Uncharacterized protein n=1 Tax=Crotalaria pallida TaxID=3830 RepID=A0AAN9F624_CROPI